MRLFHALPVCFFFFLLSIHIQYSDLCLALGAKSVYYVMALIVSNLLKPKEAFIIVQTLNQILLTQSSVLDFREYLYTIDLNVRNFCVSHVYK